MPRICELHFHSHATGSESLFIVYAMMMPFFGMGEDQLADSWLGEPETVDTERASGDDGTVEKID